MLRKQADALGIDLEEVAISANSSNEEYESGMATALAKHKALDVTAVVFGDIFLEVSRGQAPPTGRAVHLSPVETGDAAACAFVYRFRIKGGDHVC